VEETRGSGAPALEVERGASRAAVQEREETRS
jgi:hypothetical protein